MLSIKETPYPLVVFAITPEVGLYNLPKELDEEVARLHLEHLDADLTILTKDQADYIGVKVKGPFKKDEYRY